MANNDSELLNQERQRRKRINRIKTGLITTIAVWMLASLLAIIILSVQVFKLNRQVTALAENGSVTGNAISDTQSVDEQALDEESYANVVTGIDTEDNFATEGDVHNVYLPFNSVPGDNTNDRVWERPLNLGKAPFDDRMVILGHTPTCHLIDDFVSEAKIIHGPGYIDIDCGCGHKIPGKKLACLRLDDMSEFYV